MKERTQIPREQQFGYARERAARDLCQAASETGVSLRDLDQRIYRKWWLRRPSHCNMPTDICILFGTWDNAKEHASELLQCQSESKSPKTGEYIL